MNPWEAMNPDQIEDRRRELQIVRAWLTQNVAMVDACIAALEMTEQAQSFNPMQAWFDLFMPKK